MKKWLALALAGTMSFSMLTACGGEEEAPAPAEDDAAVEETAAPAEDAAAEDDAAAEADLVDVPVTIVNGTGVEIASLCMSAADVDEWSDNIIPEGKVLPHGNYMDDLVLYGVDNNNPVWDMQIQDTAGTAIDFYDLDLTGMPSDGFVIELTYDSESGVATASAYATMDELQGDYTGTNDEAAAEEETAAEDGGIVDVPVVLVNGTGVDIAALYMTGAGLDDWGENLIDEGYVLPSGNYMDTLVLTVDRSNPVWDLSVEDTEGNPIDFFGLNIGNMPDSGFVIELLLDGDTATATALPTMDDLEGDYTPAA